MKPINQFLVSNEIRIATNPCISPDFCLDWDELKANLLSEQGIVCHYLSSFETSAGEWAIVEDANGDHAWRLQAIGLDSISNGLEDGYEIGEATYFPATYDNLIAMKNLVQKSDAGIGFFRPLVSDWGDQHWVLGLVLLLCIGREWIGLWRILAWA